MRLLTFFLITFSLTRLSAQNTVQGFVIDRDTKSRLAKVYIFNPANDDGIYNNLKGEFTTTAKLGDTIFAALPGYAMDTVIYNGKGSVVFQLKSLAIQLKQVEIYGKTLTPQEQRNKTLREYKYALDRGSSKDLLNLGLGGVGLGIDAIYNLLSRQGKNARHLRAIIEKDYRELIIDYRFNPDYVRATLDLDNVDIKDFMLQYRPTYQFVLTASDYTFVQFVKNSYNSYKRNPAALRLPVLPKIAPVIPLGQ
ncbi:MAG: hypothetical protein EOO90_10885 [Pedobacter sp.]|nr:MAG: hypothetical protein EOO90_10885 [Pedobacter sp.]